MDPSREFAVRFRVRFFLLLTTYAFGDVSLQVSSWWKARNGHRSPARRVDESATSSAATAFKKNVKKVKKNK